MDFFKSAMAASGRRLLVQKFHILEGKVTLSAAHFALPATADVDFGHANNVALVKG